MHYSQTISAYQNIDFFTNNHNCFFNKRCTQILQKIDFLSTTVQGTVLRNF